MQGESWNAFTIFVRLFLTSNLPLEFPAKNIFYLINVTLHKQTFKYLIFIKVDDEYRHHSPGTAALTPPVSPLYNLQGGQSVAWYYSDQQATGEIVDLYGYDGTKEPVKPSPEAIDDLVSEHFRNCGVPPSSCTSPDYNDVAHDHVDCVFGHVANQYSVMHQVCSIKH